MDFELELGELRPLFEVGVGKDIPICNHILHNGEIYMGCYDPQSGSRYWRCITDPEMKSMDGYTYDRNNPFMVQVITYKRTKEKVIVPKEPKELITNFGSFEVVTRHSNYPVTGKNQICKSQIFEQGKGISYTDMESMDITIQEAHSNACLVAKTLSERIKNKGNEDGMERSTKT